MSIAQNITGRVLYPATVAGNKIVDFFARRSHLQSDEVKKCIAEAELTGADPAAASTQKYISHQLQFITYRFQRLRDEITFVTREGLNFQIYSYKHWVLFFRFLVRCFTLFMAGVMLGRHSVYPLVEPDSPFVDEMRKRLDV